jgi:hypothetical protein
VTGPRSEEPDWLVAGGWQRADDAHPVDGGVPAYRAVFKTLRVIFSGRVELSWPNLLVRFDHGTVEVGGMDLPGALPARAPGRWVLPEVGALVEVSPGIRQYDPTINLAFHFAARQDELERASYVELLLKTDATEPRTQLVEGRRKLAAVKVMLDLRFGSRLLGLLLTEEVGTLFEDWHFNRQLSTDQLGAESQLAVVGVEAAELEKWAHEVIDDFTSRPQPARSRFGLACEWYWTAIHSEEPVMRFLELWFAVEVTAMPNTTNVRPVRERLAAICGNTADEWEAFVGQLYGRRSRLAHGSEARHVTDAEVLDLRVLVEVLLEAELGHPNPERVAELRGRASLS